MISQVSASLGCAQRSRAWLGAAEHRTPYQGRTCHRSKDTTTLATRNRSTPAESWPAIAIVHVARTGRPSVSGVSLLSGSRPRIAHLLAAWHGHAWHDKDGRGGPPGSLGLTFYGQSHPDSASRRRSVHGSAGQRMEWQVCAWQREACSDREARRYLVSHIFNRAGQRTTDLVPAALGWSPQILAKHFIARTGGPAGIRGIISTTAAQRLAWLVASVRG